MLGSDEEAMVDRRVVVKLLTTYFERNQSPEVLTLMARMLGFSGACPHADPAPAVIPQQHTNMWCVSCSLLSCPQTVVVAYPRTPSLFVAMFDVHTLLECHLQAFVTMKKYMCNHA